jgi:hypothetical protein
LLAGSSHWLLLLFGRSYSQHATTALMVLGIAAVAVTTNVWASAMLKVTKQLSAMICANVMYAVVIIGLAAAWAHRGLVWVALAWLLGNIAASAVACGALVIGRRQPVWIVPVEPAIVGSPGF